MQYVETLIINATQLVTCASPGMPKRGTLMRDVGMIKHGAVAIHAGVIVAVGHTADITANYSSAQTIDATGKVVLPGLVDCHTHAVYAGDRLAEFEMRLQGKTYMEIMGAGGGIMSTVRATRKASYATLLTQSQQRLDAMLRLGTTAAEIKTGYGLNDETEQKIFAVIVELGATHPMTIAPTFLGPHALSPEFTTTQAYLEAICQSSLPAIQTCYCSSHFAARDIPLSADIFCEEGVFSVAELHAYFQVAQQRGFRLKAHVDEFVNLGGVTTAVEAGALSVDHLDVTPEVELNRLANSNTIGVVLPAVNFNLGSSHFANARYLIDVGGIVALATDFNPGSAPTPSLPMVMALATRYQKLWPAEALNATTINAAYAMGLEQRIGSIEVGKQADILILETPDYRSLIYEFGANLIESVLIKGAVVWDQS